MCGFRVLRRRKRRAKQVWVIWDSVASTGRSVSSGSFQRPSFWPGLPLDHVLVSEDLVAETEMLEGYGSDHRALLTRVQMR